jgi:hypothetical protein
VLVEAGIERAIIGTVSVSGIHDYDVEALKLIAILAEGLPDETLYPVPSGCEAAVFLADCEAEAGRAAVGRSAQNGEQGVAAAERPLEHAPVCVRIRKPAGSAEAVVAGIADGLAVL